MGGFPVKLVDTAGFGVPRDSIEEEGLRRTRSGIESCDLALFVMDASVPFSDADRSVMDALGDKPRIG